MGDIDIRLYNDKHNVALLTFCPAPDDYSSRNFNTELCGSGPSECLGHQQENEEQNRICTASKL